MDATSAARLVANALHRGYLRKEGHAGNLVGAIGTVAAGGTRRSPTSPCPLKP